MEHRRAKAELKREEATAESREQAVHNHLEHMQAVRRSEYEVREDMTLRLRLAAAEEQAADHRHREVLESQAAELQRLRHVLSLYDWNIGVQKSQTEALEGENRQLICEIAHKNAELSKYEMEVQRERSQKDLLKSELIAAVKAHPAVKAHLASHARAAEPRESKSSEALAAAAVSSSSSSGAPNPGQRFADHRHKSKS